MKLAISNISWQEKEEAEVAKLLKDLNINYVELALTKHWEDPLNLSSDDLETYKKWWLGFNIKIIAFQAMLFKHPELKLIQSEDNRKIGLQVLKKYIEFAELMGAKVMVFGSPKNRQKEAMSNSQAMDIIVPFFKELGEYAYKHGVSICIEPNATQYKCDFITTVQEGINIVEQIDSPGVGLHLDTACMHLANDDIYRSIVNSSKHLRHFHISSPMLGPVSRHTEVDHVAASRALRKINYKNYISIEMLNNKSESNIDTIKEALTFVTETYLLGLALVII